ncbi:ER-Golgi vesicle-tethering protein/Myosin class II heavy chain [Klebsormidium nitens]|uniref:ER-Golgi vesicle-tethering protein/Myosin class II heavy chain n=1 Tax=Klebsormidium nitens TaxID=105231 RepID=A0A1Y1IJ66_KLENI|nr:ER-Golgi vesicle-tethering protein/Myosin class II heavy chain [Klebsormidium nitens]|eukprot:GAQ88756.1 ER-Golgi vesicle-tethering protein/Myosin class II heavy chain [Klebsormidium nitens]
MEDMNDLFEKPVPVRISKAGHEDRQEELSVRITLGSSRQNRNTRVLRVQLTSEADPFFVHTLEVSEEDFQSLKVEQCILVDFATFPSKFIELLEKCVEARVQASPRFVAILRLRGGDSSVSIVETNQFKHLSHISLNFRPGNDAAVKQYLAGRLAEFKAANHDYHEKLTRALHMLDTAQKDNSRLASEVSKLKDSNTRYVSELKGEQALAVTAEKEKALQDLTSLKDRLERERLETEARYRAQNDKLQERNTDLDKQVRSLLDTKYALETRLAELNGKLNAVDDDLQQMQKECEKLRADNKALDGEKHEAEKVLNRHLIRLSALEQQVHDKEELLSKVSQQLESEQSHRAAVEQSWKESQAAAARAEERVTASAAEINKGNQIIEKLQTELRASRSKLKLKAAVTAQQENLLAERQATIEKSLRENSAVREQVAELKAENETLRSKAADLKAKLDEAQETLKSDQQMIQWLNTQVTEAQLGKLNSGPAATRFSFKPITSFTAPSAAPDAAARPSAGTSYGASIPAPTTRPFTSVPQPHSSAYKAPTAAGGAPLYTRPGSGPASGVPSTTTSYKPPSSTYASIPPAGGKVLYKPPNGSDGDRLSSATLGLWQAQEGARPGAFDTGYRRPVSSGLGVGGFGSLNAGKSREDVGVQRIPTPLPAVATTG